MTGANTLPNSANGKGCTHRNDAKPNNKQIKEMQENNTARGKCCKNQSKEVFISITQYLHTQTADYYYLTPVSLVGL